MRPAVVKATRPAVAAQTWFGASSSDLKASPMMTAQADRKPRERVLSLTGVAVGAGARRGPTGRAGRGRASVVEECGTAADMAPSLAVERVFGAGGNRFGRDRICIQKHMFDGWRALCGNCG